MNISLIGGGNMARALVGGLIARGQRPDTLAVVEIDAEARATVSARFGVATFAEIEAPAVSNADIVVMNCYAPMFVNVNPGARQWRRAYAWPCESLAPGSACCCSTG